MLLKILNLVGDIIAAGVDILGLGVDTILVSGRCSRPGRGIIVLISGVLVLGMDIIVLVSGRRSALVMTTAEEGVKRGVVNHVRRLEAGWCGRVFGGTRSHRGHGAPYYRRILGGRSG